MDRFTGLADRYAKFRPEYPREMVDFVFRKCNLRRGDVLVDVGCGTGISSRLFAARGLRVFGVEPNDGMRLRAQEEPSPKDVPAPIYLRGSAEATGLAETTANAVLAAQAFHWFDPEPALREFWRILKPSGWVVLVWNDRDVTDPFTARYGALMKTARDASHGPFADVESADALKRSPYFSRFETADFANSQMVDEDALIGRALSASYAPRNREGANQLAGQLRTLHQQYAKEGIAVLKYVTKTYVAQRRSE
jgi:ubiquinone/menaquinone biosynthesis C-methylase UbiE